MWYLLLPCALSASNKGTQYLITPKLQRQMHPTADDVLWYARQIWNRDPDKERSLQTEDIEFRELFGCGVLVCLSLWELLVTNDAVPDGGTIKHLLWTCMFLKVYAKQATLCSLLVGGVDKETYRKWCWLFIEAIVGLESHVVSTIPAFLVSTHQLSCVSVALFSDHF
jgi:hypothetical protein